MKTLVTGGAGFIGSHLVERLVRDGHQVVVLDDLSTGRIENLLGFLHAIRFVQGSILDDAAVDDAMKDAEWVFHLAALPSVRRSIEAPIASHEVNATGTLRVVQKACRHGVRRVVYASSASVYGIDPKRPTLESAMLRPASPYAASKLAGEYYGFAANAVNGLEFAVLRYFNVFGPRQDPDSQYAAVVPKFASLLLRGKRPTVFGDGEQTRSFTYVDNVVEANLVAIQARTAPGRAFNVGMLSAISINTLFERIAALAGAKGSEAVHDGARLGDARHSLPDINAAIGIGYMPKVSVDEGLERTVRWIKETLYDGEQTEA